MLVDAIVPMVLVGIFGAGHCLGMCGGISAALAFAVSDRSARYRFFILLFYNVGRIVSYGVIGAIVGGMSLWSGTQLSEHLGFPLLRSVAGLMLILMGCYVTGWWKVLTHLERVGNVFWRYIQGYAQQLFPVKSLSQAILLGMLWGWLPCGLVYTALAYALVQGDAAGGAAAMIAFGCGTLPAVLAGGLMGERLKVFLQGRRLRLLMGVCLIAFGLWSIGFAFYHLDHGVHHGH